MHWYANIEIYRKETMTYFQNKDKNLTDDEWNEMNALRTVMNQNPAALHPDKMEQFTEYLIRSMRGTDQ